jgi:integrase
MAKTEYLLQKEVDLILAALTPENRLVMRTALATGLRVGDVLALKPERLKPHFWVTEQKTGKKRQVGLPEPLLSDLKKHAGKHWVFSGRDPLKHHTRQAVWKDVKRAAKLFRLPQNVAPHSFRKVYAVDLMKRYGDIDRVRRALNHGSETITMIYALADAQMAAKYKRRRGGTGRKKS